MERRVMGNTGMKVSILGFGGAEIGFEGASLEDVEALLNEALDLGLNVIDTAGCYANSEELLGRAVGGRRR
ncbi:MAG TPA: aldo/keto reductase, partial [Candidatus Melainabacteria bacterium]|nr:aldo/keto reductase [Candidatus Melainabacteria bacterium]